MSENRFADCESPEGVIARAARIGGDFATGANPKIITEADYADALARIRELTPPTVSEEARKRARRELATLLTRVANSAALMRVASFSSEAVEGGLDRIIDALGYTTKVDAQTYHTCDRCGFTKMDVVNVECCPAPVSPPVVELDVQDLGRLAGFLNQWAEMALQLGVDINHRLPIGCGVIVSREDDGAWVLRIGGDQ